MTVQPYKSCRCYHSPYARGFSKRYYKMRIHRKFRRLTKHALDMGEVEPAWISGSHVM